MHAGQSAAHTEICFLRSMPYNDLFFSFACSRKRYRWAVRWPEESSRQIDIVVARDDHIKVQDAQSGSRQVAAFLELRVTARTLTGWARGKGH